MEIFILDCKEYKSHELSYKFLLYILHKKFPDISPKIEKTTLGKPYISNIKDFYFNISHSDKFLVIATHSAPIGVDIQKIKPINFKLVNRFFSKDEIYNFYNVPKSNQLSYFFNLWTLKESFVKCCGLGFSKMPFSKFSIIFDNEIRVKLNNTIQEQYFFHTFDNAFDNFKLSVCCIRNNSRINLTYVDLNNLF